MQFLVFRFYACYCPFQAWLKLDFGEEGGIGMECTEAVGI